MDMWLNRLIIVINIAIMHDVSPLLHIGVIVQLLLKFLLPVIWITRKKFDLLNDFTFSEVYLRFPPFPQTVEVTTNLPQYSLFTPHQDKPS